MDWDALYIHWKRATASGLRDLALVAGLVIGLSCRLVVEAVNACKKKEFHRFSPLTYAVELSYDNLLILLMLYFVLQVRKFYQ